MVNKFLSKFKSKRFTVVFIFLFLLTSILVCSLVFAFLHPDTYFAWAEIAAVNAFAVYVLKSYLVSETERPSFPDPTTGTGIDDLPISTDPNPNDVIIQPYSI